MADIQSQSSDMGSKHPQESLLIILNRKIAAIHANPALERCWGFGIISVIGVVAIVLGVFQIASDIRSPFIVADSGGDYVAEEAVAIDVRLEDLRTKDTDKDGLDDYSELYIYGTSPYLQDSDSDQVSDKDEIDIDSDPNCPMGSTCQTRDIAGDADPIIVTGANDDTTGLSSAQLRQSLIASGAPQSVVDALTDDELIELYQETVAATGEDPLGAGSDTTGEFFSDLSPEENNLDLNTDDILNPTATELRVLLRETGVDESSLDTIDDATLLLIYQEAVSEELVTE